MSGKILSITNIRMAKAVEEFTMYLKKNHITYEPCSECDMDPCILMLFNDCPECPDRITEGQLGFYKNWFEARVFYSESASEWFRESENKADIYRLLNYINSQVWISVTDSRPETQYGPELMLTPRFYITEDDQCDITATMTVPYSLYETEKTKIEDFITAALPDLLNDLSRSIFLLIFGKITVDEAMRYIDHLMLTGKQEEAEK